MRPPPGLKSSIVSLHTHGAPTHENLPTFIVLGCWLVDDGAVFETPEIKHAYASVGSTAHKDVDTLGAEANVKDLLVVRNQLRLGRQGWNIPDGAGRVDARCDNQAW